MMRAMPALPGALSVIGLALWGCGSTPAPGGAEREFVAVTIAGDEVSDESIRGQVTILDFWAVY